MLNNRIMHGNRQMLRGGSGCFGNGRGTLSADRAGRTGRCKNICNGNDQHNSNDGNGCDRSGYARPGCGCGYGKHDNDYSHGDSHDCGFGHDHHNHDHNMRGISCPLCARPGMSSAGKNDGGNDTVERRSPCNPEGMTNCEKLLDQIRAVDFALVEVVLYLDAYPDCHEALDTYHKLIARRKGLYAQYESSCGPLTAMGNKSTTSWDWVDKPFPWEYKAN